jgi:hypothetical protein
VILAFFEPGLSLQVLEKLLLHNFPTNVSVAKIIDYYWRFVGSAGGNRNRLHQAPARIYIIGVLMR